MRHTDIKIRVIEVWQEIEIILRCGVFILWLTLNHGSIHPIKSNDNKYYMVYRASLLGAAQMAI